MLGNPYVRSFRHLRAIFTTTVFSYAGTKEVTNYYRPLMHVWYLVLFQTFGPYPKWFHLSNVLLHACVVLALFKLTEALFRDRLLAFAAAALFAVHPIHTEAVDWVAAVPDLQVTLFCLLSFWAFVRLARPNGRTSVPSSPGMGAFFTLALLSKESAGTLPVLAVFYEHFCRDDRTETRWTQKAIRYAPLWALAFAYLLFRMRVLGGFLPAHDLRATPYSAIALEAIALIGKYVGFSFWPVSLCAARIYPERISALWPSILGGVAVLALLTLIFVFLWNRARLVCFGLVWFLVTLSPVLNPRWLMTTSTGLPFAERYLYLPSVGLCWAVAWCFARLFHPSAWDGLAIWRWARGIAGSAFAVVVALSVVRIVVRNRDWRDELTFYTRTLAISPNSFEMRESLGVVYYNRGDLKGAEREWQRARQISPLDVSLLDSLGLLFTDEGRYDEAAETLKKSIRIFPDDPNGHINLGLNYRKMGDAVSAEKELRAAAAIAPLNPRAHHSLGELYFGEGKFAEAAREFTLSVRSVPSTKSYIGQALAYLELSQNEEAEKALKGAEALNPWDSRPHFMLGYFYGVNGKPQEALKEYQAGFELDPDNQQARAAFQQFQAGATGAHPQ